LDKYKPFGFFKPERFGKTTTMNHIALQGTDLQMSSPIIKLILNGDCADLLPELSGKKGQLFSNFTLQKFIDEEALHDDFSLSGDKQRSIRSFSTGEQKKALLSYLLSKQSDFIILDNPFDALDKESVEWLKNKLIELSRQIAIIQIFKRKKDLLPFITHAAKIEDEKISTFEPINEFLVRYNQEKKAELNGTIPPPYRKF
jgi:molybdate transport system ATP-binding protein